MSNIVLCPNCGGQKTISKPLYISGQINMWYEDMPLYTCPTCDGRGWIRVDSIPQEEFAAMKCVALSSMETAENLVDECTKRADKIKELEADLNHAVAGEHSADREIERLRAKIFDIEGREDLVTTELERRACAAEDRLRVVKEMNDELLGVWVARRDMVRETHDARDGELAETIYNLKVWNDRVVIDLEMLCIILKIVNPLIKGGDYARKDTAAFLARQMFELCQTVVQYRRKYNIVG